MNEPDPVPSQQPPARGRFQFGLKHLFAVTLWWAVLCGVAVHFGWLGGALFVVLSAIAIGLYFRSTRPVAISGGFLLLVLAMLLTIFSPLFYSSTCVDDIRTMCGNNLRQFGLALLSYHDRHGCFPPAYIADESGTPIHSWRVLILPYLKERRLYKAYNFNEPWNGPNNSKLPNPSVNIFRCLSDLRNRTQQSPVTNYVAVVGPGTAWPGGKSTKLSDFKDGPENTILLVEVADSGIHWAEPRDLHIVQMAPGINPTKGQGISSKHGGGVNVLFADGSVRFLPETISPEQLRALLTIAGGEPVDPPEF